MAAQRRDLMRTGNGHRLRRFLRCKQRIETDAQRIRQPPRDGDRRIRLVAFDFRQHRFRHPGRARQIVERHFAFTAQSLNLLSNARRRRNRLRCRGRRRRRTPARSRTCHFLTYRLELFDISNFSSKKRKFPIKLKPTITGRRAAWCAAKPPIQGAVSCVTPSSRICAARSTRFDANGGLFETLLDDNDAIISDELNHASIIDGVRLSKAKRYRYKNNDLADLEAKLREADAAGARFKLIATDGVFSMDGIIANLAGICDLADRYGALVMVDDSHAVGFVGEHGRGTPEHCGVLSRVDIITGTLGKALGGASGGYVAARKEIVELLRQRSRPYLFSNTLTPSIAAASLDVLELLES